MKRKSGLRLPEKTLKTHVVFDEPVTCSLNVAMAGKEVEKLTDEEKERFKAYDCKHRMWPPFMPQCRTCLLVNPHAEKLVDKKGREYRSTQVQKDPKELDK